MTKKVQAQKREVWRGIRARGGRAAVPAEQLFEMYRQGKSTEEISKTLGVSKSSVWRVLGKNACNVTPRKPGRKPGSKNKKKVMKKVNTLTSKVKAANAALALANADSTVVTEGSTRSFADGLLSKLGPGSEVIVIKL